MMMASIEPTPLQIFSSTPEPQTPRKRYRIGRTIVLTGLVVGFAFAAWAVYPRQPGLSIQVTELPAQG